LTSLSAPVLQQCGWRLQEVPYIYGSYTHFHKSAKFPPEIFLQLHACNAFVLPFEKVVFLDLDTFVRRDVSSLFQQDPPAAVNNWKGNGVYSMKEGEVMELQKTSFNAGVPLSPPKESLFQLLTEDAALGLPRLSRKQGFS